jgi:hypothetical protein
LRPVCMVASICLLLALMIRLRPCHSSATTAQLKQSQTIHETRGSLYTPTSYYDLESFTSRQLSSFLSCRNCDETCTVALWLSSTTMKETLATRCSKGMLEDSDDDFEYEAPTQAISGRNIDPTKLKILLRTKFGAGSFEVQIIQNSYCINAPRKLSNVSTLRDHLVYSTDKKQCEIARCRRRSS